MRYLWLRETIESVRRNTTPPRWLNVRDDGSEDMSSDRPAKRNHPGGGHSDGRFNPAGILKVGHGGACIESLTWSQEVLQPVRRRSSNRAAAPKVYLTLLFDNVLTALYAVIARVPLSLTAGCGR